MEPGARPLSVHEWLPPDAAGLQGWAANLPLTTAGGAELAVAAARNVSAAKTSGAK